MTTKRYFGTDGIRATYGTEPMTPDFVYRLGLASGRALSAGQRTTPLIVIGRDTRTSGPALQRALATGLRESGVRVLNLGIIPTPGIAYLTRFVGANAGAVISASHNPAVQNGVKFLNAEGMKLNGEQENTIEANLASTNSTNRVFDDECLGENAPTLFEVYLQDMLESVPGLNLEGVKIVLDCANGAAYAAAPEIMRRLGAELVAINTECDGININVRAGSENLRSKPEGLAEVVAKERADVAIAFDGDADRVILMDEKGNLIDGDHMLALFAGELHQSGKLLGDTLVTTVMANGALTKYADERGFTLKQTPVGDKYVTEALLEIAQGDLNTGKLGLGGEQSGHIILMDENHRTGDGIRTALFLLNILRQKPGLSLSQFANQIQKYNQVVASCNVASKPDLQSLPRFQERLERIPAELPGLVQINSRYSGTESKYRLMLEADSHHNVREVAKIAWDVCDLIQELTDTPPGAKIEVLNVAHGGLLPRPSAE
jgi:phosphoglucosamine mutase